MKRKGILLSLMILFGVAMSNFQADAWRGKFQSTTYIDSEGDTVTITECKYHLFVKQCNQGEGDVEIGEEED